MGSASIFMYVALAAFVPVTFACFWAMDGRRAMLWSLLGGWLLLPVFSRYGTAIPLLHTKSTFVPAFVLAASLLLDSRAWSALRLRAVDLPILVISVSPFFTSLATDKGAYDGASGIWEAFLMWGAPYFLGRVYLGSREGALEGAKALVAMGLAALPLILWEIRMSPQLHRQLYGFHQHNFGQHVRDGHYRPMIFLQHGLEVGMLMTAAAVAAVWLWRTGALERLAGVRMRWVALALVVGALLCRATGAAMLLVAGVVVLESTRLLRARILAVVLVAVPTLYCALRIEGIDTAPVVQAAQQYFGPERAVSLRIRLENDAMLTARSLQRPLLGWGRWSDVRVRNEDGQDVTIVDSFWILQFATAGLIGLAAAGLILALPLLLLLRRYPPARWAAPEVAPVAAMAVIVGLWAIDDLLNALRSPVYPLLAGAVVTYCGRSAYARRRRRTPPPERVRPPSPVVTT